MAKLCPACYSPRLRLSAFRSWDVARLILLRYPVRCLDCTQRSYLFLPRVLSLKPQPDHQDGA